MGKFSKHIGEGEKVIIDGEEFILKPLGLEWSGHFMEIGRGFSGAKQEKDKDGNIKPDVEGMFKNVTDETKKCIKEVILETLKVSYPDEPVEELNLFGGKYYQTLLPVITKLNGSSSLNEEDPKNKAKAKLEEFKQARKQKDGHTK